MNPPSTKRRFVDSRAPSSTRDDSYRHHKARAMNWTKFGVGFDVVQVHLSILDGGVVVHWSSYTLRVSRRQLQGLKSHMGSLILTQHYSTLTLVPRILRISWKLFLACVWATLAEWTILILQGWRCSVTRANVVFQNKILVPTNHYQPSSLVTKCRILIARLRRPNNHAR